MIKLTPILSCEEREKLEKQEERSPQLQLSLVPKFYLGTQLDEKLYFENCEKVVI